MVKRSHGPSVHGCWAYTPSPVKGHLVLHRPVITFHNGIV